ncbi:MAG: flagellar biosynthesis protein FlhA [bacterium]|nr:flagellar biosynthesis protein FlhA [bacterium]
MRFGRRSDTFIALFVVAVTALFLLHVPPFAIDLLIVLNISISILLLFVSLYAPDPGKLFTFPTILLLSTLFRLGLNVASTRLILLEGYAGEVIQAFGQFLVQGEVIVGVVIFSIITVVNYIVVAKGASRVAEVAARFTLDSMPIKQMSIESDMRAGLLTSQEASKKRDELRKESQLYGSMDGAMKFVQGDVIAGIVIIFTNIFGGLYVGIRDGLAISEALQTYTILTVGDGLVSQIPSLLIAICAGILVTRVSSGTDSTLGMDVGAQFFKRPEAWILSGIVMLLVSILPGPPFWPFAIGGSSFLLFAYYVSRSSTGNEITLSNSLSNNYPALLNSSGSGPLALAGSSVNLGTGAIELFLDSGTIFKISQGDPQVAEQRWQAISEIYFNEVGLKLPRLIFNSDSTLASGGYNAKIGHAQLIEGVVPIDSFLVELHPEASFTFGLVVDKLEVHPIFKTNIFWTQSNIGSLNIVRAADLLFYDQLEFIFLKIVGHFKNHPEELVTVSDVYTQVKELGSRFPGLIIGLIDNGLVTVPRLTKIVQQLARENIYVGDLRSVLESIAGYFASYDNPTESVFVIEDLVEAVRQSKKREFLSQVISDRGTLRVITLGEGVLSELQNIISKHDGSENLKIDRNTLYKLKTSYLDTLKPLRTKGIKPICLMCEAVFKQGLARVIMDLDLGIRIVTDVEIDSNLIIEEVGEWTT